MNNRQKEIEQRCIAVAFYVIENEATVREAADVFKVSESTIYKDLTWRIDKIDSLLAREVRKVLKKNKEERSIRGGLAQKMKWGK